MSKQTLKAEKRELVGRKVKSLRKQGLVPANIFGKKIESLAVQVDLKAFDLVYKEAGETGLVELSVGTDKRPVLVHGLQLNPKTDEVVHIDFLQVDLKEKVEAQVPVEVFGESPAEKQSIGTVVQHINEITVEALPADLPEKFEVDKSVLETVDQAVFVKDLKVDSSKVTIINNPDDIVVKVEPPQKIVEEIVTLAEGETGDTSNTEAATEAGSEDKPAEEAKE